MQISPDEAREALLAVRDIEAGTRRMQNLWSVFLLVWGVIWLVGFGATQFLQDQGNFLGWLWAGLGIGGWIACSFLGIYYSKQMRSTTSMPKQGLWLVSGLFPATFLYTMLLFLVAHPLSWQQGTVFYVGFFMFVTVLYSLWYQNLPALILGITVTLFVVAGYYLVPGYFWLWTAIWAGGLLCMYSLYQWRWGQYVRA